MEKSTEMEKSLVIYLLIYQKHLIALTDQACLAKLNADGFSYPALKLVYGYLPNRKQRTKTNFSYSKWPEIAFGVQQGSILDQLIFNIFLTHVFSIMNS